MSNATPPGDAPAETPAEGLVRLFIGDQLKRIQNGQRPVRRATFFKEHGSAHGTFTVLPGLSDDLRVGVFAGDAFAAWVRFSSDTGPVTPDENQPCGIAIKLFGVPGTKLVEPDATTHDFILQNYPIFFVDDVQAMYDASNDPDGYFATHPKANAIANAMGHDVDSVARIPYWSALASRFGPDRYVKYKLVPDQNGGPWTKVDHGFADYLAGDLKWRLLQGDLRFTFCVQFQTDDDAMPIDRGTVEWDERVSPPVPVATLLLPRQDVDAVGQPAYAENLTFSPWHALAEHEPVGSIQEARKVVYPVSTAVRHWANGVPVVEPREPHPTDSPYPFPSG
jgi:hypothetical protein